MFPQPKATLKTVTRAHALCSHQALSVIWGWGRPVIQHLSKGRYSLTLDNVPPAGVRKCSEADKGLSGKQVSHLLNWCLLHKNLVPTGPPG